MTIKSTVDNYISLKKQIEQLEKELEAAKLDLKSKGVGEYAGTRGIVVVAEAKGRETTDWKLVQTFVRIPADVLAKCTKIGTSSYRMTIKPL